MSASVTVDNLIVMRPKHYVLGLCDLVADLRGEDLIGVEIGSFQGESAGIFLSSGKFRRLYCIDAWTNGYDPTDAASWQASRAEAAFDRRFSCDPRVVKVKGYSQDVCDRLPDGIDFLYIDGNHQPDAVLRDLQLYAPKVRIGGVIAGHDYEPTRYSGLMAVVDAYLGHPPERRYRDTSWATMRGNAPLGAYI